MCLRGSAFERKARYMEEPCTVPNSRSLERSLKELEGTTRAGKQEGVGTKNRPQVAAPQRAQVVKRRWVGTRRLKCKTSEHTVLQKAATAAQGNRPRRLWVWRKNKEAHAGCDSSKHHPESGGWTAQRVHAVAGKPKRWRRWKKSSEAVLVDRDEEECSVLALN